MCSPTKLVFLAFVQWLFLLPLSSAMTNGFTTVVEAGKVNCFYENIDANKTLEIEYQMNYPAAARLQYVLTDESAEDKVCSIIQSSEQVVEGGGEMDITLQVISPHGALLVNDEKKTDEMHTVTTADTGIYTFCFDNSFSTLAEKIVYVDLGLEAYDEESWLQTLGDGDVEGTELKIESIRNTLENIRDMLEKAQQYQSYLTKKNYKSHAIVSRSSSRVFWWSLIQSIALIGVGICQVLIVKNFFGTGKTNQMI